MKGPPDFSLRTDPSPASPSLPAAAVGCGCSTTLPPRSLHLSVLFSTQQTLAENLHWARDSQREAARPVVLPWVLENPLLCSYSELSSVKRAVGVHTCTSTHMLIEAHQLYANWKGPLVFSLPLFFQYPPLGVVSPDTIHYQGQTSASTIIILPQPRQHALSLSSLFTLRICSQQQLWRQSVELADVKVWMSCHFHFCFAVFTSRVLQLEWSTYPSPSLTALARWV